MSRPSSRSIPAAKPAPRRAAAPAASLPRRDAVHFTLRSLEPWVGWSIAIYTALLAIVEYHELPWLWLFVAYAALIGQWAQFSPARQPNQLFMRAAALIAGAFVALTLSGMGARYGLLFVWLSIPTLCYAFMLARGWAYSVLGLSLVAYLLAWFESPAPLHWQAMLAQGMFLGVFAPLVAMRFGASMRRLEQALESSLRDGATSLYNRAGLLQRGEELAEACRAAKQPLSLVVFEAPGLHSVNESHGRATGRKLLRQWVRQLLQSAGERGLAARTGHTEFALLLPGLTIEKALLAVERQFGSPLRAMVIDGAEEVAVEAALESGAIGPDAPLDELLESLGRQLRGGVSQPMALASEPAELLPMDEPAMMNRGIEVSSQLPTDDQGFAATNVMTRPMAA